MARVRLVLALLVSAALLLLGVTPAEAQTPFPRTSASWRTCVRTLDGITTKISRSQRTVIIVNQTSRTYARVSFWVRRVGPCSLTRKFLNTTRPDRPQRDRGRGPSASRAAAPRRGGRTRSPRPSATGRRRTPRCRTTRCARVTTGSGTTRAATTTRCATPRTAGSGGGCGRAGTSRRTCEPSAPSTAMWR